ncbi:mitochondrial intermembrane space import and assembly protein 40 [[Candida] railenensis]|uniref:Mitochondrial intermembrane space import and assembly protein 40 n=1 Tax=[Candida] railenensis TaxID=45579 RepID=A0A9P0QPX5_9ASCO|nr:mitochondrial intermembrane space import and assembly protein 40 [[Candida] railenensis]
MFRNSFRSFTKTVTPNLVRIPFVIGGTAVGVSYVFLNSSAKNDEDEHKKIHNGHGALVDSKLADKLKEVKTEFKQDEKTALKKDIVEQEKVDAEDTVQSDIAPVQEAPEAEVTEEVKEEKNNKGEVVDTVNETEAVPVNSAGVSVKKEEDGSEVVDIDAQEVAQVDGASAGASAGGEDEAEAGADQGQQAAYNPETGEINWDCPCLGGMANGPCGEEFKEAFACFVYSETEPKGIDCIKKFENMRTCFRKYPEHYKEELYEDEATEGDAAAEGEAPVAEAEAS